MQKRGPVLSEDFAMASPAAMWDQDSGMEILNSNQIILAWQMGN